MLGIGKEAAIFLYAGLSGVTVFLSYQILVLLRRLFRHSSVMINIEDFLYWLAASAYLFRQMYRTTYGSIRWFFALGVVAGTLLAYLVKKLTEKIGRKYKKSLEKRRENR